MHSNLMVLAGSDTQPPLGHAALDRRLHGERVGLEFLKAGKRAADHHRVVLAGSEREIKPIHARARFGLRLPANRAEAVRGNRQILLEHLEPGRIVQSRLQRQIVGKLLPVLVPDHITEVEFRTRHENSALAVDGGVDSVLGSVQPPGCKTAVVNRPCTVNKRQPGNVIALNSHDGHGTLFPVKAKKRRQIGTTLRITAALANRRAIGAKDLHLHSGSPSPSRKLFSKHGHRAVGRGFCDESQIRDENDLARLNLLLFALESGNSQTHHAVNRSGSLSHLGQGERCEQRLTGFLLWQIDDALGGRAHGIQLGVLVFKGRVLGKKGKERSLHLLKLPLDPRQPKRVDVHALLGRKRKNVPGLQEVEFRPVLGHIQNEATHPIQPEPAIRCEGWLHGCKQTSASGNWHLDPRHRRELLSGLQKFSRDFLSPLQVLGCNGRHHRPACRP